MLDAWQECRPAALAQQPWRSHCFHFSARQSSHAATSDLRLKLPLKPNSVRFAVIGDNGTGDAPQFEVAREMEAYRQVVGFSFVIMLGDNIYGGHSPEDFARKFEEPYKPLLDAGVKFYASLGNHDNPDERHVQAVQHGREALLQFQEE